MKHKLRCLTKIPSAVIDASIADVRMGDLVVKAKPGVGINISQIRHEFLFGTAVPNSLAEQSTKPMSDVNRNMYLKILEEHFNYAVHENALKWYVNEKTQGAVDYSIADRIYQICEERNIPMRGHCIFWEKEKHVQSWIKTLSHNALREAVKKRAASVASYFKGRIEEFDLNNEMIDGDFYRSRLGDGIVNEMAQTVKAANTKAKIYVNDYGVLVENGFNASAYFEQIAHLIESGVPLDGIGCQGHIVSSSKNDSSGRAATLDDQVWSNLNRLAAFNLPIKITECLVDADTEEGRAEELSRFFRLCFAHPSVEAIIMWGFWARGHWIPRTAMWKADWNATPQALVYRDLVFRQWWTQVSGKADSSGIFKTRAFFGDYEITVDGVMQKVSLHKKDKSLLMRCP